MSSAARGARRRAERTKLLHDTYGVQPGWCATAADLPDACSQTHDMLIESMGARRYGPVSWSWWEGDEATEKLAQITEGTTRPDLLDGYRRIGAHLREYGGFLVIASAPGHAS